MDTNYQIILCGHSLGARTILDAWYKLAIEAPVSDSALARIDQVSLYNPYVWIDSRYYTMLSEFKSHPSKFANLYFHCIDGDYSSVSVKANPIGQVIVYPSVALPFVSTITHLTRLDYFNTANHSLAAFCNDQYAEQVTVTLSPTDDLYNTSSDQVSFVSGNIVTFRSNRAESMPLHALNSQTRMSMRTNPNTQSLDPLLQSFDQYSSTLDIYNWEITHTDPPDYRRHYELHNRSADDDDPDWYIDLPFKVMNAGEGGNGLHATGGSMVLRARYAETPTTSNMHPVYLARLSQPAVDATVITDNWYAVDLVPTPGSTFTFDRYASNGPMAISVRVGFDSANLGAEALKNMQWLVMGEPTVSHRREATIDPMWQLKVADDIEFAIQQPGLSNFYMEQQEKADAGQDFAALILKDSTAATSNNSGITWRAIYNSVHDTFEFNNVQNHNISLGFYNVWYVLNSGNQNMNLNSVVDCTLTSTGQPDEYYITQQTATGITVTLSRVTFTHDSTFDSSGNNTSWPMTWYQTPDLSLSKFIIRPYDEAVDDPVPIHVQAPLPT